MGFDLSAWVLPCYLARLEKKLEEFDKATKTPSSEMEERKLNLYQTLKELESDYQLGNLPHKEYKEGSCPFFLPV